MTYEEKKIKATELRKSQNHIDALTLYRELYDEIDDKFNASGLLHCLRKTDNLEEAVQLADEIKIKYLDFDWFKNEIIWTFIQGRLLKLPEDDNINETITIANQILELKPDGFALTITIFRVLKVAKKVRDWKIVLEWSSRLDVNTLDDSPMVNEKGREGWSKKSLWYNYRINALIEDERYDEAEVFIDQAIELYPKFKKFFIRLRGIIKTKQGDLEQAQECYKALVNQRNVDWWLLHEYGSILKLSGKLEEALQQFYLAATKSYRLESSVKLFYDIATLCMELDKNREAVAHLFLAKFLREKKGWSIPYELNSALETLSTKNLEINYSDLRNALEDCRKYWSESVANNVSGTDKIIMIGTLSLPQKEGSFAFININEGESVFCLKKDLPKPFKNGDKLNFAKVKSIDKKKNKESWKAINIKRCS